MARPIEVSRRVERIVKNALHEEVYDDLLDYLERQEPSVWGIFRNDDFLEQNLLLALYHDISGFGYQRILREEGLERSLSNRSFQHNTELIRHLGASWAKQYIDLPLLEDRQDLASLTHQSHTLGLIDLWVDSSDFMLQKARGVGRKHPDWSYKENHCAQRYLCVTTGDGVVRMLCGGYSPKVHDSTFLDTHREEWESLLLGSRIIGDEHFRPGGERFRLVHWVTPYRNMTRDDPENPGQRLSVLTQAQQTWNSHISDIRSRIESTFGHSKQMFMTLQRPWAERKSQQDYLVTLAIGIHNKQKL